MKRAKVTDEIRKKWKEQFEFLACNEFIFEKLNEWEENFIISIGEIINKQDLTFHQSTKLNEICNKYQ